jgi:dimethylargininase
MNKLVAILRKPNASILNCELTHITRDPINLDKLYEQHIAYGNLLKSCGVSVLELPPLENFPDAVFVEDTAIILDEVAIISRPGAVSRRAELERDFQPERIKMPPISYIVFSIL